VTKGQPHEGSDSTASMVVVGLDNGGTNNNATVLTSSGHFLVGGMVENPSRVREGPAAAVDALAEAFKNILVVTGRGEADVSVVGLGSPGPASALGVISSRGATNFPERPWWGFDLRGALEERLGLPVFYSNDGNAAAVYAHGVRFGAGSAAHSSVTAVVGTGLGGGVVQSGFPVQGAVGMGGEVGHVHIPLDGLLEKGQPVPRCNCGFAGDAESIASLTAIEKNLLPYWLTRFPGHPLASAPSPAHAAKQVRALAEAGDALALRIFDQQAQALGRLFTIVGNVLDPHAYFVGGGVVEAAPHFRDWFLDTIREHTTLRPEQAAVAEFGVVPDRDMAGARVAAIAALAALADRSISSPQRLPT
jgi:glucokinase